MGGAGRSVGGARRARGSAAFECGGADLTQAVHDLVPAAAEVVVQPRVLGVEGVVRPRRGGVGPVDVALDAAHRRRGRGTSGYSPPATPAWVAAPSAGPRPPPARPARPPVTA